MEMTETFCQSINWNVALLLNFCQATLLKSVVRPTVTQPLRWLFNSGDCIYISEIIKVMFTCEDYLAEQTL